MNEVGLESILVATDLSEAADDLIRAAAEIARVTDAELHLVHSHAIAGSPYPPEDRGLLAYQRHIHEARRALQAQAERAAGEGGAASCKLVFDTPAQAIVTRAEEVSADLIVMGPHRGPTLAGFFLGSTADRVIRTAAAPCLILRGSLPLPLRHVLVPLDLSDPARGALDLALAWTSALSPGAAHDARPPARIRVAHVISGAYDVPGTAEESALAAAELHNEIEDALQRHGEVDGLDVREDIIWAKAPAEEIVRLASDGEADLIVLGTHGHGAFLRALIGSVSSHVARRAPCSVLLVPPPLWQEGAASAEDALSAKSEDAGAEPVGA